MISKAFKAKPARPELKEVDDLHLQPRILIVQH